MDCSRPNSIVLTTWLILVLPVYNITKLRASAVTWCQKLETAAPSAGQFVNHQFLPTSMMEESQSVGRPMRSTNRGHRVKK